MPLEVKKIDKKYQVSQYDSVKFQLLTELIFFRKLKLSISDIELLALLAIYDIVELNKFCAIATKFFYPNVLNEEFASKSQNIRNRLNKLQKQKYVYKDNQRINVAKELSIIKEKNLLLTYNLLSIEPTKA